MTQNIKLIFFLSIILIGISIFYDGYRELVSISKFNPELITINKSKKNENLNLSENNKKIKKTKKIISSKIQNEGNKYNKFNLVVSRGQTLSSILKKLNFSEAKRFQIINEIEKYFNLRQLKENQKIVYYKDKNKEIKLLEIYKSIDSILSVKIEDKVIAEEKKLKKIYYQESNEFNITESLYSDGINNGLPQVILIKLIKLFSFDLDFQRDIRKNTKVSVSYDFNQIKDTKNIEYIDINYALISIEGKKLEYFKFLTDEGYIDYFNREGKNVKKSILKTPLDGARISSNFGMRKHPISGYNKMHQGVDFAAPTGTPIYAGGNGIIEYVGNNGGYGKYIRIRHNNEYKTAYAHLSKYGKGISKGVRVNQGDIIGFVGSTGVSTGPHLHYEILFQNKQINPLKLKLPSGKILKGEEMERFKKVYKEVYANHLNLLYE